MVAEHLLYLQQYYWQSRYSISFPRLRPCAGGVEPASLMNEAELVIDLCFRLLAPNVELSLSTRESPYFRDHVVPLATSVPAQNPTGGYADTKEELEQFSPNDNRSAAQVAHALCKPVYSPLERLG